jgi:uncharacterized repeat protein (TIGR01451 family)
MSVNAAEMSCDATHFHAMLDFFLTSGSASYPDTPTSVLPCSDGTLLATGATAVQNIYGGTFLGDEPVLFTGTSVGLKMINEQGSGNGNDHAFDDISLDDVTPQLDKSFSPDTAQAGGTATLTFTITNTDDLLAKDGWSFTDTLPKGLTLATPAAAATTCPAGTVTAPDGGSTVSVTGGDLDAGQASCTVSVHVTSATTGTYTNDASNITAYSGLNLPGSSNITFVNGPTVGLVKSVSPGWFSAAGQKLTYTFVVDNSSAGPLSGITVTDSRLGRISCPSPTLARAATVTCTATYVTTAADLRAGSITNTATATATPETGPPLTSGPATVTVPSVVGAITLRKTAAPASYSASGQLLVFGFLVTNTSAVPMSAVAVPDTALPGLTPVTCPQPTLEPGASERCVATYRTTQRDVDRGYVFNVARARGNPPGSMVPIVSDPASVTVPAVPPLVPVTG